MSRLPSLIAFGSLSTCSSIENLRELHQTASLDHSQPIKNAIQDLPNVWEDLSAKDERLSKVDGLDIANALASWMSNGEPPSRGTLSSNLARLPLTISRHICDYLSFVQRSQYEHSALLASAAKAGGSQGFCVGLLSAVAVAGSATESDVASNGAFVIRLAFALGAYVELDAVEFGQTSCLALRWKPGQCSIDKVKDVLNSFDGAYISVIRDANEVTITVGSSSVAQVSRLLSSHGVSVLDTGLNGRFHSSSLEAIAHGIVETCKKHLPTGWKQHASVRSNSTGAILPEDNIFALVLEEILTRTSNWPLVLKETPLPDSPTMQKPVALAIRMDAVLSSLPGDIEITGTTRASKIADTMKDYPKEAIAITGMSCNLPGACGIEEFWELLKKGSSMVEKVPDNRWPEKISSRGNSAKGRFWGNFIRNIDAFDHRFFKKSSREASSMDPQQRLLLQGAYEAMESAGYFSKATRNQDVGCYLGLCAVDYDANVQSHPPTAYSTLGSLRAFLSGKISHYFGWFGPSLTFDTACSSSAVAIHTACRALQAGECTEALAGGVALFTTPYLYENLAAAHFLSPTGATKPFDAKADGYCRGEGVGLVVLKKLSKAIVDGDDVLAVIGGSAVNQNANCVSITVPHAPSQENLYIKAARQAGIDPYRISFVEAHGTGTPVGDPIEMDSIRTTFCGLKRHGPLYVSSVKGNIGHLEGASGVAGLIKAVLQIQNRAVPKQASFQSLNPSIPPLSPSNIIVPTSTMDLPEGFLTACVNNYGAAGSNSTLMLLQPPSKRVTAPQPRKDDTWPIQIAANTEASLKQYCLALDSYIRRNKMDSRLLPSLAYQLGRRTNQTLPYMLTASIPNIQSLSDRLSAAASTSFTDPRPSGSALILAFGGQVRDHVGLSKDAWEDYSIFRSHVDRCDRVLQELGHGSLYPAIFQTETVSDVVVLHASVFAVQYASSIAWIDSGLQVEAVIGHSLGQLTALAVSGVLSLEDGLKFVAGRASLMKKHWGPEAGSMILVDGEKEDFAKISGQLEFACYNAPSSHVLVGSRDDVDKFEGELASAKMGFKRLQVTNGFHSRFTDPLVPHLKELASTLKFNEAKIRLETCSRDATWVHATPDLLADHTRSPVYFHQAVERLAKASKSLTWLEAGIDSGITSMARRALGTSSASKHGFISVSRASASIANATMQLWTRGHMVQYWKFHALQKDQYRSLRLPSYQWEGSKHWLELRAPAPITVGAETASQASPPPPPPAAVGLVSLRAQTREASWDFNINPACDEYRHLVSGHVVAGSPLCPATVYLEVAARAVKEVVGPRFESNHIAFSELSIDAPLGLASKQDLTLELRPAPRASRSGSPTSAFDFRVISREQNNAASPTYSHATGTATLHGNADITNAEFARFERLTGQEAIDALLDHPDAECIRGPTLYKIFSRVVEYSLPYRGLKSVTAHNGRIAGTVATSVDYAPPRGTLTHPLIVDSWMQISGINANNFLPCPEADVYVFTKLDRIHFGPSYTAPTAATSWLIFSNSTQVTPKERSNDIFVFDAESKRLVVLILGARFSNVRLSSLRKVLSRVNSIPEVPAQPAEKTTPTKPHRESSAEQDIAPASPQPYSQSAAPPSYNAEVNVFEEVCALFERVAEVPRTSVKGSMTTDDLGIDSLMMMEVISELSTHFAIDLPTEDMVELTTVDSLTAYLRKRGCGSKGSSGSSTKISASPTASSENGVLTPSSSAPSTVAHSNSSGDFEKLGKLLQEHLELASLPKPSDNLADMGLDSLLCIELGSDIEKLFSVSIDFYQVDNSTTVQDLARLAGMTPDARKDSALPSANGTPKRSPTPERSEDQTPPKPGPTKVNQAPSSATDMQDAQAIFNEMRLDFDTFSNQEGFTDFWSAVYPDQARLVQSYIANALKKLGCDLAAIGEDEMLSPVTVMDKHKHLLARMYHILIDGAFIKQSNGAELVRTAKVFDLEAPDVLLNQMISTYPLHKSEHRLLNITGSRLAECLTGKVDPLSLLFANKTNRQLLADVYDLAPMCRATTRFLARFLEQVFSKARAGEVYHFLEVGGGTGGTTRFLLEYLTRRGVPFTYTFTDVSSALVSGMKKAFAAYDCVNFATLDAEKPTPAGLKGRFHAVISTNCIHATRNATSSLTNLRELLLPDGVLALVEFTNGLYWFDLVYGLLDGWWLFSDGRKHALADTAFWERSLNAAGYGAVSWSDGTTPESRTLRVICGFNSNRPAADPQQQLSKRAGVPYETVTWKEGKDFILQADIFYPAEHQQKVTTTRPIVLLFHGGGHVLFTRQDIHMKHIKTLLQRGYLPITFDYRLCPETTLAQGPMTDACDALHWTRTQLPHLRLARPEIHINADKVAAVGWSAGGHLAMTLAFTAPARGIKPPDAVLAFYCPSNFEAEWWQRPIFPKNVRERVGTEYELLEGVRERCLVGYKPLTSTSSSSSGNMSLQDPRWRIIIHYNWKAQILPVLIHGLPCPSSSAAAVASGRMYDDLPMPSQEEIRAVSPFAKIVEGKYRTPTFIVHGDQDDLIPWTQSRDTIEALTSRGVEAGISVPEGAGHAFDLENWGREDEGTRRGWEGIGAGWDFIGRFVFG